ncbi:arylsulfatase B-like isoform X2 [Paramacrobiotus metropolitanus]|nr:arylsulfatase B-like isoform X2 [Paramacrobiotus metropolitanus]
MVLNSHYSQSLCTPSRTALLTGKYPTRLGMQSGVLGPGNRRGIPLKEKLLPQYFKELGYATHMVGKWHVGYAAPELTPTHRGFDSYFGYYNGYIDYFTHDMNTSAEPFSNGFDLWDGFIPATNCKGQYLTDIFTDRAMQRISQHNFDKPLFLYLAHMAPHWANEHDPVQTTDEYINRFPHIHHEGRQKYAGTLAALDDSVGKIMDALHHEKADNNTIVIFLADNGGTGQEHYLQEGAQATHGSNWPLRGTKNTWFEGGVRTVGIVWSRLLQHPGTVWNGLMHLTDWLPTLMTATGGMPVRNVDGVDQWKSLVEAAPSMRNELLMQADAIWDQYALRWYQYKLLVKENPITGYNADRWYVPVDGIIPDYVNASLPAAVHCAPPQSTERPCHLGEAPCLFDLEADPCERDNVAADYPDVVKLMLEKLLAYNATALHSPPQPEDPLGLPSLHGGLIQPWLTLSDLPNS